MVSSNPNVRVFSMCVDDDSRCRKIMKILTDVGCFVVFVSRCVLAHLSATLLIPSGSKPWNVAKGSKSTMNEGESARA